MHGIVSARGSGRILTFSVPHVFKALQLLDSQRFVSRSAFCERLHIGEGAAKTLISHLKERKLARTVRSGTCLTETGRKLAGEVTGAIPRESAVRGSGMFGGRYNHAVLIKDHAHAVRTGVEQRDRAIPYGASAALTLVYHDGRFSFPGEGQDALIHDRGAAGVLGKMNPEENDVIIIASADDPFVAEMAAKNSAIWTVGAA